MKNLLRTGAAACLAVLALNAIGWAAPDAHTHALAFGPHQRQTTPLTRPHVNTANSFTVSAWVKFNTLNGLQPIVSQSGSTTPGFALQKRTDDDRFAFTIAWTKSLGVAVYTAASDFTPTPRLWYQIAGVYDAPAKQIRLYADGTPLASAPITAFPKTTGPPEVNSVQVGGMSGDLLDGAVDEVHTYARALSDAQMASLYAADKAKFEPKTFTWANPIYFQGNGRGDDIHDPDIIADGGAYYCVATLAPFANYTDRDPQKPDYGSAPGVRLYASRDLKVWKAETWLLKSSDLPDTVPYKHQFWAPELHKINGRYFLIVGASNWIDAKYNINGHMGYYQFVGVADKIMGPYTHFTALKGPGVDTSLFQDDDGKTYVVWPWNEIHAVDLTQIDHDRITVGPKLSQATTPGDFQALGKPVPGTVEGPYLIKHAGTYYCFFAETYPDLYATGIATSTSLSGPWHLDPRWRVFPGGHQAEFVGPDGRWWTAYKHEHSDTTPWLSVDHLDFDANGSVQVTPTEGPQSVPLPK